MLPFDTELFQCFFIGLVLSNAVLVKALGRFGRTDFVLYGNIDIFTLLLTFATHLTKMSIYPSLYGSIKMGDSAETSYDKMERLCE